MNKSSFTKAQKEELAQIFLEQLKKITPASACKTGESAEDEPIRVDNKNSLEELGKKWEDGAKDYYDCSGKHMIIATEDYVDPETGKKYFTWKEAMALEKEGKLPEGWHIPTVQDWAAIVAKYGLRTLEDGSVKKSGGFLKEELGLGYNGWIDVNDMDDYNEDLKGGGAADNVGTDGYYWSASATSTASDAYDLVFNSGGVAPQCSDDKYFGFSVRCVAERQ